MSGIFLLLLDAEPVRFNGDRIAGVEEVGVNDLPSDGVDLLITICAGRLVEPPISAADWFRDTPWSHVPSHMEGTLIRAEAERPRPRLLGGSSKLAKLAEERRKKAAAATEVPSSAPNGALSALDRLSKPKDTKENALPSTTTEPRKYPIRKKRDPTPPPPREPTPPLEPEEEQPDLRTTPTEFGRTLSTNPSQSSSAAIMTLGDVFGSLTGDDPFKGPSPDDTVMQAQRNSKGLSK